MGPKPAFAKYRRPDGGIAEIKVPHMPEPIDFKKTVAPPRKLTLGNQEFRFLSFEDSRGARHELWALKRGEKYYAITSPAVISKLEGEFARKEQLRMGAPQK